jgi:hypothetical protein
VTLDRVVWHPTIAMLAAASHARRLLAFSYRAAVCHSDTVAIANGCRRLFRRPFRAYVHRPLRCGRLEAGNHLAWAGGTWVWAVEIYERGS